MVGQLKLSYHHSTDANLPDLKLENICWKNVKSDPAVSVLPKALGKTETAGSDFTFFQQIFSNLRSGRFASVEWW